MPGHDFTATIPQLCVALNCLPIEILQEDYNSIRNILAVFEFQAKRKPKTK